jgi:hypothetical protein
MHQLVEQRAFPRFEAFAVVGSFGRNLTTTSTLTISYPSGALQLGTHRMAPGGISQTSPMSSNIKWE